LTDAERAQVAELLSRLEQECAEDVGRVILYGSKARGDATQWSDIDLLVVTASRYERVKEICYDLEHANFFIAPIVFSHDSWENNHRFKLPFYVNVRRAGIELWDENAAQLEESQVPLDFPEGEWRPLDYETIEVIRMYVAESHEMWRNAQVIENDGRSLYAMPSAYRAAFSLATAVLYTINVVRDKHKGVYDTINQFLVKPKLLQEEYKVIYGRLFDARAYVDYGKAKGETKNELTPEQATELLRDTERLIARFEQFLRERGALID
jgi:uncharacterized protein (UPF0332 family)/predicted nucleotidyltransferase